MLHLREERGFGLGRKIVCGGASNGGYPMSSFSSDARDETDDASESIFGVDPLCCCEAEEAEGMPFATTLIMFSGCSPLMITVATPAAVASSAAMSLVCIPPVPKLDPIVATLTAFRTLLRLPRRLTFSHSDRFEDCPYTVRPHLCTGTSSPHPPVPL